MRRVLGEAVAALFAQGLPREPRELSEDERSRLIGLATLVVRCRSAVERDGYSREIELVPSAESPTRLVIVLERLLAGLDAIGLDRATAWRIVSKVALDSVPALRLAVIDALYEADGELSTTAVAEAVRHPTTPTRRALEDLTAHSIVERIAKGQGKADEWLLSAWTRERYTSIRTFPEKSGGDSEPTFPEKSGKVYSAPNPSKNSPLSSGGIFRERLYRAKPLWTSWPRKAPRQHDADTDADHRRPAHDS